MERIIAFLASDLAFALRLCLTCDRQQLGLELQPAGSDPDEGEWFTLSLFRRLVTGQRQTSAVLDAAYAQFLEENLDAIERRGGEDWDATRAELEKLRVLRSRERTQAR